MDGNIFIDDLIVKFAKYENWILSGNKKKLDKDDFPPSYMRLFSQNKRAYDYYRQQFTHFIREISGEGALFNDLIQVITDMENIDERKYYEFIKYFESMDLINKFKSRWNNAYEFGELYTSSRKSSLEITQLSLALYQSKYEIEEILLILAILRKFIRDHELDLEMINMKDNRGSYKKGVMADYIIAGLSKYPNLRRVLEKAYQSKLRNIIGHNNYRIENGKLVALDGSFEVTHFEFVESFYYLQEVQNAVLWLLSFIDTQKYIQDILDCGIFTVGYSYHNENQIPKIILYQLWCFFRNDMEKVWLKEVNIEIKGETICTCLSKHVQISGTIFPDIKKWIEYANDKKEVVVEIIPIIPFLGTEQLKLNIDGEYYQICGNEYCKKVTLNFI